MRINNIINNVKPSDVKKKKNSSASEGLFSGMIETEQATEVTDTEVSISVNSVISNDMFTLLNSVNDQGFNNKLNVEWGRDILDDLEMIRNQILFGKISEKALYNVEEKLRNIPVSSEDTKLKNIVEEIRTRALVELAKLEKIKQ